MRKLLFLFALLISTVVFSQFTRSYNLIAFQNKNEKRINYSPKYTTIVFDGRRITVSSDGMSPLRLVITSAVKKGQLNGYKYEEVEVTDMKGDKGTFLLFEDRSQGSVLMTSYIIIGYRWVSTY